MAIFYIEIIGWIGAILILSVYFLLTLRKLTTESKLYYSLNLLGGIGVVIKSISNFAYPPAVINIV